MGGSGLESGLLSQVQASGLLEPPGWTLPPWDLLGGPPQMAIDDFHLLFLTSSHQRLINTEPIIGCCVVAGATSTSVSALASRTSVRTYSVTSYQHQHCQQQRSIMTNIKIDNVSSNKSKNTTSGSKRDGSSIQQTQRSNRQQHVLSMFMLRVSLFRRHRKTKQAKASQTIKSNKQEKINTKTSET